jgi:hypothetical protein
MAIEFRPIQTPVDVPACMPAPAPICKPLPMPTETNEGGPAFQNGVNGSLSQTCGFATTGAFDPHASVAGKKRADRPAGEALTPTGFVAELRQLRASGAITSDNNLRAIVGMVELAYKQGLLDRTDAQGMTLLQRLREIATTASDPDLQGKTFTTPGSPGHVLLTVLTNITQPNTTEGIQQYESTCATKAMEYMMATQDPAGYAHVIGQLAAGHDVKGQDGTTLILDRTALKAESSPRNMASRLFQASVNHTMATNWLGHHTYTNADKDMVKTRGLDEDEAGKAVKALLGPGWQTHSGKADLTTLRMPALAAIRWHMSADEVKDDSPSNGHAVIVEKVENGRVFFRDPGEGGEAGKTLQADGQNFGPKRLSEGNNLYSMPAADFAKLVSYYSEGPAKP